MYIHALLRPRWDLCSATHDIKRTLHITRKIPMYTHINTHTQATLSHVHTHTHNC